MGIREGDTVTVDGNTLIFYGLDEGDECKVLRVIECDMTNGMKYYLERKSDGTTQWVHENDLKNTYQHFMKKY